MINAQKLRKSAPNVEATKIHSGNVINYLPRAWHEQICTVSQKWIKNFGDLWFHDYFNIDIETYFSPTLFQTFTDSGKKIMLLGKDRIFR